MNPVELKYYPFMISLDECSGSFNMNECECFTFIPINSLHVYKNKCYMQDNLDNCDNCAYKIAKNQTTDYLHDNVFEDYIL